MPSWWMPLSWAKAFLPTTALLGWTGKPETAETRREMRMILEASTPLSKGMMSGRTLSAITTSSSGVLPARSPRPLTVHSIWRAPASTAARELAVAMPRSSWQWVAKVTPSAPGTPSISIRIRAALSRGAV